MTRPLVIRAFERDPADERATRAAQTILDATTLRSGSEVKAVTTPSGEGSPAGVHTHPFDQLFYIVQGRLQIEIDGSRDTAEAGDLVLFPAGLEHRSWNGETTVAKHLAINLGDREEKRT